MVNEISATLEGQVLGTTGLLGVVIITENT